MTPNIGNEIVIEPGKEIGETLQSKQLKHTQHTCLLVCHVDEEWSHHIKLEVTGQVPGPAHTILKTKMQNTRELQLKILQIYFSLFHSYVTICY